MDTVLASELSLSGSYLEESRLDDHSEVDLSWCCTPMGFSWSLYLVQASNESAMTRSLEPTESRIMNDRASLATFFLPLEKDKKELRAPNILFLLTTQGLRCLQGLGERQAISRGLKTHEQGAQTGILTCLGN